MAADDATHLGFAELDPRQDGATCSAFLRHARAGYDELGNVAKGVMTDGARADPSGAVPAVFRVHRIRQLRTQPHHPQANGEAERFIQTAVRRWAVKRPYGTPHRHSAAPPPSPDSCNLERPHRSLGAVPPLFHALKPCEQRVKCR